MSDFLQIVQTVNRRFLNKDSDLWLSIVGSDFFSSICDHYVMKYMIQIKTSFQTQAQSWLKAVCIQLF